MVKQSRGAAVKLGRRRGASHKSAFHTQYILYLLMGVTLLAAFIVVFILLPSKSTTASGAGLLFRRHRKKPIKEADNVHNSLAMDIITSLKCQELQDPALMRNIDDPMDDNVESEQQRRRLAADDFGAQGEANENNNPLDDDMNEDPLGGVPVAVNAKHFMCLVAGSPNLPSFIHTEAFHCNDALGAKRPALLEIWSLARTRMSLDLLKKTLELAQETPTTLLDESFYIWAPAQDQSLEFLQHVLNDESSAIRDLQLGKDSLFVDVGSGLGLTTLVVARKYPQASILSIEPASPNWLLQNLNLVCNHNTLNSPVPMPILAGVGPDKHNAMAKMLWRPSQTRLTRTWTSKNDTSPQDLELVVTLRTLRSILAEFQAEQDTTHATTTTKVMNLDCEGCEYNLIPAMSEDEFSSWNSIIGTTGVHWGYIPMDKLPSSRRGETTHKRLCRHYDFARQCIECCAFPELKVLMVNGQEEEENGEVLTAKQVAGTLCDNFADFAERTNLHASNDDYGWTELSSMSEGV